VEKDYKEMYLKERFNSLQIELNMLNMRASAILNELPTIEEELKAYAVKSEESDSDKA
jgi:glutamate formiminotransferase